MNAVHATCIAIDGRGVLIMGPSGSGKSDLALRLIDRGAQLVSDDYTELAHVDGILMAAAPASISGKIEVRGIGIVSVSAISPVPVALVVASGSPERMPEASSWSKDGVVLPRICLSLLEPSAPLKVELAFRALP